MKRKRSLRSEKKWWGGGENQWRFAAADNLEVKMEVERQEKQVLRGAAAEKIKTVRGKGPGWKF